MLMLIISQEFEHWKHTFVFKYVSSSPIIKVKMRLLGNSSLSLSLAHESYVSLLGNLCGIYWLHKGYGFFLVLRVVFSDSLNSPGVPCDGLSVKIVTYT